MNVKSNIRYSLPPKIINVLRGIKSLGRTLWRLNVIKTVYINFKMLPFNQAIKFPIFIYGKIVLHSLNGKMIIDSNVIHSNMIKIGYRWFDLWPMSYLPSQLNLLGTLYFHGPVVFSGGVNLAIQKETATIHLGAYCRISGGCTIKSMDELIIGDYTRITGGCIVMNSNMHYVKNIETGVISKHWGKIMIGTHCWINANTVITKGAVIPNYSITARNSFLNRDYSEYGENLFLVGSPAVVKKTKVQRIYSDDLTLKYDDYFNKNPNSDFFMEEPGIALESDYDIDSF